MNVYIRANDADSGPWPIEHVRAQYNQLAADALYRVDGTADWRPIAELRLQNPKPYPPTVQLAHPQSRSWIVILGGGAIAAFILFIIVAGVRNCRYEAESQRLREVEAAKQATSVAAQPAPRPTSPPPAAPTIAPVRTEAQKLYADTIALCAKRFIDPHGLGRQCCEATARGATEERNRKTFAPLFGTYLKRILPGMERMQAYEQAREELFEFRSAVSECGYGPRDPMTVKVKAEHARVRQLHKAHQKARRKAVAR